MWVGVFVQMCVVLLQNLCTLPADFAVTQMLNVTVRSEGQTLPAPLGQPLHIISDTIAPAESGSHNLQSLLQVQLSFVTEGLDKHALQ